MKTTIVINHTLRLLLEPETDLERGFLNEMAAQSEKGATTILALPAKNSSEFALEVGGK